MTNAITTTQTTTATSTDERLAGVAVAVIIGLTSMISLWSFAGLAGAVVANGMAEVAHGFLTATFGG
jgi:hypothetical protein